MYRILCLIILALPLQLPASFSSIIFHAGTINNQASTTPDFVHKISEYVNVQAWNIAPPPSPKVYTVAFNVPHDYIDTAGDTLVIVHFTTKKEGGSITTGNVTIELDSLFATTALGPPLTTQTTTVTGVASTSTTTTYNHYTAIFTLASGLAADDFLLLDISRNATGDTYTPSIYLTSVEFRYNSP